MLLQKSRIRSVLLIFALIFEKGKKVMRGNAIVDLIFLLVGVAIVLLCAKRGFLKSAIHFLRTVLAFVLTYFLGGKLAQLLSDKWILHSVQDFVYDRINGIYQNTAGQLDAQAVIDSLPSYLMTEEMQEKLHAAQGSGEELVLKMTNSVSQPIASFFSNILGYIGVFILAVIGLWIAAAILDKVVSHIKFLNSANTLLGAVLGLLITVTVWLAAASLMKVFFADSYVYNESVLVKFLGDGGLLKGLRFLDIGGFWFEELLK